MPMNGLKHTVRRRNIHLYPDDWKKLPIPDATPDQQAPIVALVDHILSALRAGRTTDVSTLERQVDRLVADLYGVEPAKGGKSCD
jgi:adenine-specific DNA-methyltransferase